MTRISIMNEQKVGDINLVISYNWDNHTYTVKVSSEKTGKTKSEDFNSSYEPKFGMDVQDMNEAFTIAEILSCQLEEET